MSYDAPTIAALESGELVLRDLLYVSGWDSGGSPDAWGFWIGEDDVSVNVVSGITGETVSRDYVGGGTLLDVPAIIDAIGLESRSAEFVLSQIHSAVADMVRGARIRGGRVELHRAIFDPATWALVSTPFVRFVGFVDTVQIVDAAVGSEGRIAMSCSSDPVDLTHTSPALKSDASQQAAHPGDTFRQYDTAGEIDVRWGQAKGKAKK